MIPDEVAFSRAARSYGMAPWQLERALEEDPRAFRWYLMADPLAQFEAALAAPVEG